MASSAALASGIVVVWDGRPDIWDDPSNHAVWCDTKEQNTEYKICIKRTPDLQKAEASGWNKPGRRNQWLTLHI